MIAAAQTILIATTAFAATPGELEISSAVIKVAEEVSVPAREAGVLAKLEVKEGQLVDDGALIARLLDNDARLTVDRAKLEAVIALRKFDSDVNIKFARKSTDVARAELTRSLDTNVRVPKTVSNTELDRQRLLVEKGELEVKLAEHEHEIAGLTRDIRENELRTAEEQLERRRVLSPLKGMVVEVHKRRGEWVQPGEMIARVVRIDRLRVEGFLPARHARLELVGSAVKLKVVSEGESGGEFPGQVVFVSPEIDPLNAQVRIWADVENSDLKLRPGMQATLVVMPK